jgi:MFS family permease
VAARAERADGGDCVAVAAGRPAGRRPRRLPSGRLVEWRVLACRALFLYSFGYGGITSFMALYADANGVTPRALYFTVFAGAILVTRPFIARYADRVGYRRVFLPCLGLVVLALALLAIGGRPGAFVVSALVFGTGFGSAYPAVRRPRDEATWPRSARRGLRQHHRHVRHRHRHRFDRRWAGLWSTTVSAGYGFAGLAACAIPYFLIADRWLRGRADQFARRLSSSPLCTGHLHGTC